MLKDFHKWVFKWIGIFALLPALLNLMLNLPPEHITLIGMAVAILWQPARRLVGTILKSIGKSAWTIIKLGIFGVFSVIKFLIKGYDKKQARFMPWFKQLFWLDRSNRGFLIDGHSSRLPLDVTYQGSILQGGMGTGKAAGFIIPNLLNTPADHPSFVVSDTSGEIYEKTSGYLASIGYQIRAFNLLDVSRSETYNPLIACQNTQEVAELAQVLVRSSMGAQKSGDPFWNQAAEKLIRILAQCLLNQSDDTVKNLYNLRHLILSFDAHNQPAGQLEQIDQFVLNATQNDPQTFACL